MQEAAAGQAFPRRRQNLLHVRFIASLKAQFKFSPHDARHGHAQKGAAGESDMLNVELNGQEPGDVRVCDVESCFARGIMFSSGREVEVDMVQAHKWFNIAAARGHAEGAQMRREIAALMSDSEIGCAQRAARDWLKANPLPPMQDIRAAA
jgi:TPR repeat protein